MSQKAAEAWFWEDYADNVLAPYVLTSRWLDERNWAVNKDVTFGTMPGILKAFVPDMIRKQIMKAMSRRDFLRRGMDQCWKKFSNYLDQLNDRAPEHDFWLGEISVADIALFSMLQSIRTELTIWQRDEINQRKRLAAYLDRVDAATRIKDTEAANEKAA